MYLRLPALALLIRNELKSLAWLKGKLNPYQHPILWGLFNRYSADPKSAFKHLVKKYDGPPVTYDDGFEATTDKDRRAFYHYIFGMGSLPLRRNNIIGNIYGIENDRTQPGYRKGWEAGYFKRYKENLMLMPFAEYLARQVDEDPGTEEAEVAS